MINSVGASLITAGLTAVSRNGQKVPKKIDIVLSLLEGRIKFQKQPSGDSEYMEFYDKNGEMVATYSNKGWTMYTTDAEAARQIEMCMIYNEAWGNAKIFQNNGRLPGNTGGRLFLK